MVGFLKRERLLFSCSPSTGFGMVLVLSNPCESPACRVGWMVLSKPLRNLSPF